MRPIELTFSGLRSYRDTTTIDFSRLDLFAVIGDTGAGKSTIIEALSLALYAKKSWTGGPAALGDMIADGVNTMRIVLRFRADGHEWVVTRARHRNTAASVDKLTSPTGGGPNVDGARNVTERITELVGLDHDQFTRAVVLPQGRFDLLLRATESQRTEILSSILGLGDVAVTRELVTATRDRWAEHAVVLGERRQRYPADPAAASASAAADALADRGASRGPHCGARRGHGRRAAGDGVPAHRRSAGACARGGAAGTARSGSGARRAAGAGRGAARRAAAVGRGGGCCRCRPRRHRRRRSPSCSAGSRRGMR